MSPLTLPSSATVPVRDTALFVRSRGEGAPALFIHAGLLDSMMWLDQIEGLRDVRLCIAPDLRGFGRSEPNAADRLDVNTYVADVTGLLDQLGIDGAVDLVGTSLGARIAAMIAVAHPQRVRSLTLVSGSLGIPVDLAYRRYQTEMARLVVVESKDVLFRRFDEYIFGPKATLRARARYKEMLAGTRAEMFVALLTHWVEETDPDLLGRIEVPTLLLNGGEDAIVTPSKIAAMLEQLRFGRSVTVPEAGRLISLEAPEAVNQALRDFWTGI